MKVIYVILLPFINIYELHDFFICKWVQKTLADIKKIYIKYAKIKLLEVFIIVLG